MSQYLLLTGSSLQGVKYLGSLGSLESVKFTSFSPNIRISIPKIMSKILWSYHNGDNGLVQPENHSNGIAHFITKRKQRRFTV